MDQRHKQYWVKRSNGCGYDLVHIRYIFVSYILYLPVDDTFSEAVFFSKTYTNEFLTETENSIKTGGNRWLTTSYGIFPE